MGWDTSSAWRMRLMFYKAKLFNQPIGQWDTSSVVDMEEMFRDASRFKQTLSHWDTSRVTDSIGMMKGSGYWFRSGTPPVCAKNEDCWQCTDCLWEEVKRAFDD